jgi:hypothetical protein
VRVAVEVLTDRERVSIAAPIRSLHIAAAPVRPLFAWARATVFDEVIIAGYGYAAEDSTHTSRNRVVLSYEGEEDVVETVTAPGGASDGAACLHVPTPYWMSTGAVFDLSIQSIVRGEESPPSRTVRLIARDLNRSNIRWSLEPFLKRSDTGESE